MGSVKLGGKIVFNMHNIISITSLSTTQCLSGSILQNFLF
jgi:hypothetical protein